MEMRCLRRKEKQQANCLDSPAREAVGRKDHGSCSKETVESDK
jgi:hypothetical protein